MSNEMHKSCSAAVLDYDRPHARTGTVPGRGVPKMTPSMTAPRRWYRRTRNGQTVFHFVRRDSFSQPKRVPLLLLVPLSEFRRFFSIFLKITCIKSCDEKYFIVTFDVPILKLWKTVENISKYCQRIRLFCEFHDIFRLNTIPH
jgi:hypothetical protein